MINWFRIPDTDMKQRYIFLTALSTLLLGTSCANFDEIGPEGSTPATDIDQLSFTSSQIKEKNEACVTISFTYDATKTESDLFYVRASYYDPYLGKEVSRLGSADNGEGTVVLPKTFAAAGTYSVTITPVSSSDIEGTPKTIDVRSVAVEPAVTIGSKISGLKLTTNAQEPSEGPIENATDGNINTFFHSAWSVAIGEAHYLIAELPEQEDGFHLAFVTRNNGKGGGNVQEADLQVSADGETWSDPVHEVYDVQSQTGVRVEGGLNTFGTQFRFVRFTPTKTAGGGVFFNLAEFELYGLVVVDFEAEAQKMIDAHGAAK